MNTNRKCLDKIVVDAISGLMELDPSKGVEIQRIVDAVRSEFDEGDGPSRLPSDESIRKMLEWLVEEGLVQKDPSPEGTAAVYKIAVYHGSAKGKKEFEDAISSIHLDSDMEQEMEEEEEEEG